MDPRLLAFTGLAALLTIMPGVDMALVMRSTLTAGRRAAWFTSLGVCSGLTVHGAASAVGLSALLNTSAVAFTVVKTLGAAYLVILGVQTVRESFRGGRPHLGVAVAPAACHAWAAVSDRRAFVQGLLTNVLNPKVAVFYLTVLPQFISPGDPVLARSFLLAGIHIAMGLAWLSAYVWLLGRLGAVLSRPRVKAWMERVTGGLLVGLGLRLAWERR